MKIYALLAALLFSTPAFAQFVKPDGVPTAVVPGYNVTIGVWATFSPVGGYIGVFEQHSDGQWYGFTGNGTVPDTTFSDKISAAGGPSAWLASVGVPKINSVLAARFPAYTPVPGPVPSDPIQAINYYLSTSYTLKQVGGVEALAPR